MREEGRGLGIVHVGESGRECVGENERVCVRARVRVKRGARG